MARFFYDWEFLEDGVTIVPISVGIVEEGGGTYYAVNRMSDEDWERVLEHEWLPDNVVPFLPTLITPDGKLHLDKSHPDVKPLEQIAQEVRELLTSQGKATDWSHVELWATCCAYDHVALAQLWGPMSGIPNPIPYFTYDLTAFERFFDVPKGNIFNPQDHNALSDAEEVEHRWQHMRQFLLTVDPEALRRRFLFGLAPHADLTKFADMVPQTPAAVSSGEQVSEGNGS